MHILVYLYRNLYIATHAHTALIHAADYGRADCARLLLDAGADKNAKCSVRLRVSRVCIGGVVR